MDLTQRLKTVVAGTMILSATMGTAIAAPPAPAPLPHETSVSTSILDGMTIQYSYIDGTPTSYKVSFENGLLDWEERTFDFSDGGRRVFGPVSGVKGSPYKAHQLSEDEYMVSFIEDSPQGDLEWASLHINLKTRRIYAASLFNYGPNRAGPHIIHWAPGFIYAVSERK